MADLNNIIGERRTSKMSFDAKAVANSFLDLADANGEQLDPMQVQRMVYFSHGWHLAMRDAPLIENRIEAWEFGPVIPTLYHEFKMWGNGPVQGRATEWDRRLKTMVTPRVLGREAEGQFSLLLIQAVWNQLHGLSSIQLSNMAHAEGTPWHDIYLQYDGDIPKGVEIPNELIKAYFKNRLEEYSNAGRAEASAASR